MRVLAVAAIIAAATFTSCAILGEWSPCRDPDCASCRCTGNFTCTECAGSGQSACDGGLTDLILGRDCQQGTVKCTSCDGDGDFAFDTCSWCKGSGRETCHRCRGTMKMQCPKCGGDGIASCGDWVVAGEE
jgi:hypothetical protein